MEIKKKANAAQAVGSSHRLRLQLPTTFPRIDFCASFSGRARAGYWNFNFAFTFSLHIIRSEEIFIYLLLSLPRNEYPQKREKRIEMPSAVNVGASKISVDNRKLEKQSSSPCRGVQWCIPNTYHPSSRLIYNVWLSSSSPRHRLCRRPWCWRWCLTLFTFHFGPRMFFVWQARYGVASHISDSTTGLLLHR